jgi:hypothetical protein
MQPAPQEYIQRASTEKLMQFASQQQRMQLASQQQVTQLATTSEQPAELATSTTQFVQCQSTDIPARIIHSNITLLLQEALSNHQQLLQQRCTAPEPYTCIDMQNNSLLAVEPTSQHQQRMQLASHQQLVQIAQQKLMHLGSPQHLMQRLSQRCMQPAPQQLMQRASMQTALLSQRMAEVLLAPSAAGYNALFQEALSMLTTTAQLQPSLAQAMN